MKEKELSKFLSLVLRHQPDKIGIQLDKNGWTSVDILLEKLNVSMELLNAVVINNDKKRFAFNNDKSLIRANQGHSVTVDLALKEVIPHSNLFHGTALQHVESILKTGLNKGNRHHVHMSDNHGTAVQVGLRSGTVVLFEIDTKQMLADGYKFYKSENGVYLTEFVPVKYLTRIK